MSNTQKPRTKHRSVFNEIFTTNDDNVKLLKYYYIYLLYPLRLHPK